LHPSGGCFFARHGSYTRVTPQGLRIFWKHAGIEPARAKPWKPKPNLLAFLQSL
jgi:hypothetical protein